MEKEERIKVVFIQPGEKPKLVEIENTLKGYYGLVGDPIQAIYPFEDDVAVICNDEGKLNGMPHAAVYRLLYNKQCLTATFFFSFS